MVPGDVEDQVVALATVSEVVLSVVDNLVCAHRSDDIQFRRVVYTCHIRSVGFGEPYGDGATTSAGAIDQHPLAWVQMSLIR